MLERANPKTESHPIKYIMSVKSSLLEEPNITEEHRKMRGLLLP